MSLYAQNGQPFAQVVERHVIVDLATATMSASYTIEPGAKARFGAATIDGLHRVARDFVTRRIAWKEGAAYDERLVEATRRDLVRSALFSGVQINHADTPAADGTVAMTLDLIEGPPHSVGIGAGYNTTIGLGARTFWEDRDLFGAGEDLRLSAGAAQRQLGVAANFRRPDFLVPKQDLLVDAELLKEKTDAYASRRARAYVGLEELMFPPYTLGGGVSLERAYLTETSRDENYLLLGTPLYVRRDTTDDLLDPTTGTRTTVTATPYHGLLDNLLGGDLNFLSMRVEGGPISASARARRASSPSMARWARSSARASRACRRTSGSMPAAPDRCAASPISAPGRSMRRTCRSAAAPASSSAASCAIASPIRSASCRSSMPAACSRPTCPTGRAFSTAPGSAYAITRRSGRSASIWRFP